MTRFAAVRAFPLLAALAVLGTPVLAVGQSLEPLVHSVPRGTVSTQPLAVSLREAVERALDTNLTVIVGEQRLKGTESARLAALSELLPRLSGSVRRTEQLLSTAAFGFSFPGLPTLIGPFGLFDARVSLSLPLFDARGFGAIRSGRAGVRAEQASLRDARDTVVLAVTSLYLQSEAADARVNSVRAEVATAETLLRLAEDQRAAGLVAGIDVLRQEVQLQSARARLIDAETTRDKSKLSLARAIGLPAGQMFTLSDTMTFTPAPAMSVAEALREATAHRADLRAAEARVAAAKAERSAEAAGRLPTVHLDADVGALGPSASSVNKTYSVGAVVRVPIFEGGNTRARVRQAEAELSLREAELADLSAGLSYQIEEALLDIRAAEAAVAVASRARELAQQELEQAQDRFRAGVSSTLELVQAQEAVATATEQHITTIYAHAVARAAFVRTTGQAEDRLVGLVGGQQQ